MSHSVERHLEVAPDVYDVQIRRFVPGYEEMLEEVAGALLEHLPGGAGRIVDLGAGTGALSQTIAARLPAAQLTLVDVDAAMLAEAEARLAAHRARIELRRASFTDALPECDAAVASLSLHHIHAPNDKSDMYRNVLRALRPGGVFVNADATVPTAPALAEPIRRRWAAHLVEHGDTQAQAFERFAQWATEDRYFGIDEELEMLRQAGFVEIDVRWRVGPSTVIVARRSS